MDEEKRADSICLAMLVFGFALFIAFLIIANLSGMDLGGVFMRHISD